MYTKEMEAKVTAASPMDLAGAKALGAEIGMTYRSVIAKAKSLGLDYIPKPAPVKKVKEATKAELAADIEGATGLTLPSLAKASRLDLLALVAFLD